MQATKQPTQQTKPIYTDVNGLVSLGLYKSKGAVYAAVNKGNIPRYKQGKRVLFKIEEIETLLTPIPATSEVYVKTVESKMKAA
jgi:hypothetical protein